MHFKHLAASIGLVAALAAPAFAVAASDGAAGGGDASIAQIYQAAESGNMSDADRMIAKVLQDHPDSAKAHYVHAELLSKEGKIAAARDELAKAEQLAPGLPFAKADSTAELRQRLQGASEPRRAEATAAPGPGSLSSSMAAAPAREPADSGAFGFSPGKLALGVLAIAALFFVFRRFAGGPRSGGPMAGPIGGQGPAGPYGPGGMPSYGGAPAAYGYPPGSVAPGAAPGSGLGGALMTGAAVGLGAVAVEEAVRHFSHRDEPRVDLDDRRAASGGSDWGSNLGPGNPNADMGGNDFGISDAGSWDDGSGGGGVDPGGDWN